MVLVRHRQRSCETQNKMRDFPFLKYFPFSYFQELLLDVKLKVVH